MQKQSPSGQFDKLVANSIPAAFAVFNKKGMEELADMQSQWLGQIQEASQHWIDRMQSEAKIGSEFAAKLTSARSLPDAMAIYQEWSSRRFEMMAEDGKHLLACFQKLMETNARLLSNGRSNGAGAGS